MRFDSGGQTGLEHDLPREVRFPTFRDDDAKRDPVDTRGIDRVPLEQSPDGVLRQRQGSQGRERLSRFHERGPRARDDRYPMLAHVPTTSSDATLTNSTESPTAIVPGRAT